MFGAIIGDIVGSVYEWRRIKTKSFEFFVDQCEYTDDSICTAAVAEILMHDLPPAQTLQRWCREHPRGDYGGNFAQWIRMDPPRPYDSFGNGAAMRVSPAAYLNRNHSLAAALEASDLVTAVTHNHPEGLKGARATVHAIWLAFQGEPALGHSGSDRQGLRLRPLPQRRRHPPRLSVQRDLPDHRPRSPYLRP